MKGFSERNIKLMTQFYREYPGLGEIGQRAVAQVEAAPDKEGLRGEVTAEENLRRKGQRLVARIIYFFQGQLIIDMKGVFALTKVDQCTTLIV